MNNVSLVGRLTRDPELRTVGADSSVCNVTVAINRVFTSQTGEKTADFVPVVVWNRPAENLAKYCRKGSQVAVTGRIQTRSYDHADGTKRYVTEVYGERIQFLDNKRSEEGSAYPEVQNNMSNEDTTNIDEDPFKDFGSEVVLSDDDLPF